MARMSTILLFIVMTFLCWGSYGPVLHEGQGAMGSQKDLWRPFIFVGVAYFLVAVCGPLILRKFNPEPGNWSIRGIIWSLIAGTVGALGSLGILLAFSNGGKPLFVMPLVFGCAPVVNTVFTMFTGKTARQARLPFFLGILLVAVGAAGVLRFKPSTGAKKTSAAVRIQFEGETPEIEGTKVAGNWLVVKGNEGESIADVNARILPQLFEKGVSVLGIRDNAVTPLAAVLYIVMTALCWGTYGPFLHRGQNAMDGSRMRPFICVGIAYFIVAIVIPSVILLQSGDEGSFRLSGSLWSLAAGILGAVGALGVILAFNSGGKPVFVMPLVFGGAPVVNTFVSMFQSKLRGAEIGSLNSLFLGSLAMVIIGAIMVLVFAPKSHPKTVALPEDPALTEEPADPAPAPAET